MLREIAILSLGVLTIPTLTAATNAATADWAPTSSPLVTRWAKDVSPEKVWTEYPRPQFERAKWKSLNGLWDLALRENALASPPRFDRKILVPFSIEAPLSGIGERARHVAYRRSFELPADWKDQRVLLHFDAVDWQTSVTVNGKLLKTLDGEEIHQGGYDRFSYDITDALTTSGQNEIQLTVFDPTEKGDQPRGKQVTKSHGIWYTPTTGIWQSVWLEPVSTKGSLRRVIFTPNAAEATINIKTQTLQPADGAQVEITIPVGPKDTDVAKITMGPDEEVDFKIPNPHLWSPEDPFLYHCTAALKVGDAIVDEVKTYFGLRDVAIQKIGDFQRITLNGKEIFQVGPLDQGFWPDGNYTPPTEAAMIWDVDYAREVGFNMIRKHIKVEPDRWYYYCDKVGMLVWQDSVNGEMKTEESHRQFEHDMFHMIDNHWNHPSIVLWTVFNEGWGQYDTERLTAEVKKKDPTRLVTNASGWVDKGVGDTLDMHQYPGPGAPVPDPKRASVLGEFGGLGYFVKGHSWVGDLWGYQGMASLDDLWDHWSEIMRGLNFLRVSRGLCAAVYTQTTDVEIEANGLVTYDREVKKMDSAKMKAIVDRLTGMAPLTVIAPTALHHPETQWQFTEKQPSDDWATTTTESADWQTSAAGFGKLSKRLFGKVGTRWTSSDIWIRREVEIPAGINADDLRLMASYCDTAEFYINGVKAAETKHYVTGYTPLEISAEARATIKPGGRAVLAVHCHKPEDADGRNKDVGQYVDAGIVAVGK